MRPTIETTTVLRLAATNRLQWEASQRSYVLLYPEGMVKLSETAAEILRRLDGTQDTEKIITSLETAYEGVTIRADIIDFLSIAHERGWISIVER